VRLRRAAERLLLGLDAHFRRRGALGKQREVHDAVGLEFHENPYMVSCNDLPLEPGIAFSVEPGIYLHGQFGIRIEDIVVCTDDGMESLNDSDRSLVSVS
jgi:Xaa-Pro aminopeptidase